MLRIALRVRLRFRSAQDDTEGEKSKILKEQSLRHGKPCHLPLHKGGGSDICFKSKEKVTLKFAGTW